MKTISEAYHTIPAGLVAWKNGKTLLRISDVLEAARKQGLENPEELLKREVKAGEMKIFEKDFIELDLVKELSKL
ncbi:MAG: hypothetical protein WA139_04315 [Candidatus Aenigmatarchaeota archaeon]